MSPTPWAVALEGVRMTNSVGAEVEGWERKTRIASGGYGIVWKAVWRGRTCAIKEIKKWNPLLITTSDPSVVGQEIRMLNLVHNIPQCVRMYDSFQTGSHVYIVMELLERGQDLVEILKEQKEKEGRYTQRECVRILKQLLHILQDLHRVGIIHRDIKPDNVFVDEDLTVTLLDFGFANMRGSIDPGFVGTPRYTAPEVLRNPVVVMTFEEGIRTDLYSVGALAYPLLSHSPAFYIRRSGRDAAQIVERGAKFHEKGWEVFGDFAKEFVRQMLSVDPLDRLTVEEALEHPFLSGPED